MKLLSLKSIFGFLLYANAEKGPNICGAGNSVDIQCRIFANFKDETLKPVVHVAWSKFANFRNIAICTLPMMFPPLLPHLEAVFSVFSERKKLRSAGTRPSGRELAAAPWCSHIYLGNASTPALY